MTKAKHIISDSVLFLTGHINDVQDAARQEQYTKYNLAWADEFPKIVYSLCGDEEVINNLMSLLEVLIKPPIELLFHKPLGSEDDSYVWKAGNTIYDWYYNEYKVYEYAKNKSDIKYLWKFEHDTIAAPSIFDFDIDDEYDFFYINRMDKGTFTEYSPEKLMEDIKSEKYFHPQHNYYIIKNIIDDWSPDLAQIQELKTKQDSIDPDGQPSLNLLSDIIANNIKRKNIKHKSLLSDSDNEKLVNFIHEHSVGDADHKNILYTNVGDLCHLHYTNIPVAEI